MGVEKDLPAGEQLLNRFQPFIEHLVASGLSAKTIRTHVDNLWTLGGEIIRDLHYDPSLRKVAVDRLLRDAIHEYGGPRFVNYGAVGTPKDGDARGALAALDAGGEDVSTSIHRVAYDSPAVAVQVRADRLPDELAQKLVAAV